MHSHRNTHFNIKANKTNSVLTNKRITEIHVFVTHENTNAKNKVLHHLHFCLI